MLHALRAWCAVTAIALSVVGPGALVAAADDGPPRSSPTDRPTRTILRPAEVPELARAFTPRQSQKEAILLVSGINSYPQDPTYDRLIAELYDDPRYELFRFGADPAHPYDTLGRIDDNARSLADEVRALGATHPAVHIVAHSMGGAVADRAFADGLSSRDGVATYVALASPHNGSPTLAAANGLFDVVGDYALEPRALFSSKLDPGSPAARDLSRTRPVASPSGVTRLDIRMATDWTVTARDARDPGVTSRTLVPSDAAGYFDGHGSVTRDPQAISLVTATIAGRAIPRDARGESVARTADLLSGDADALSLLVLLGALAVALAMCACLRLCPALRLITRPLAVAALQAARRK